jgi:prepilin-type N-terminal cleavage/methylation domain-containing protein
MNERNRSHRQAGLTLVEVVVALAIIGTLTVAAWKLKSGVSMMEQDRADSDLVTRVDRAILAFAALQARLPCPAAPGEASEDCSRTEGTVPWQSLGLPDASAGGLHYKVGAGDLQKKANAIQVLRMNDQKQVVLASYNPSAQWARPEFAVDFCGALGTQLNANAKTSGGVPAYSLTRVSVSSASSPASGLALPNGTVGIERSTSSLWSNLHCGDLIAAGPRAHADASLAASMMSYAADEQKALADIDHDSALAAFVFALHDSELQSSRLPYKYQTAAMSCTNMESLLLDVFSGSATPEQHASIVPTTTGCVEAVVDLVGQMGWVTSKLWSLVDAINLLRTADQMALDNRTSQAQALRELAVSIGRNVQTSIYSGLYLHQQP